jgi:hypothetical protein
MKGSGCEHAETKGDSNVGIDQLGQKGVKGREIVQLFWFLGKLLIAVLFGLGGLFFRWATGGKSGQTVVYVRRDWNDRRIGKVRWSDLGNLRWDTVSGGTQIESRKPFVYAHVWCNRVQGDIAHSCLHGPAPHNIKVCLIQNDNKCFWNRIIKIVGPEKSFNKR